MVVETTARDAHQYGYNQVFVTDAMAANSKDEHEASTKYVFPKIGLLRTTNEIISAMTHQSLRQKLRRNASQTSEG